MNKNIDIKDLSFAMAIFYFGKQRAYYRFKE